MGAPELTTDARAALAEAAQWELARRHDVDWMRLCVHIVDKRKRDVLLELNPIQQRIEDEICQQEAVGQPVRIVVLKARQEGVSTYVQAKILRRAAKEKNINALVVAHLDDQTAKIFQKAQYMYERLPARVKPLQRASNAQELKFDRPTRYKGDAEGLNSSIRIHTAASGGVGRSDTLHYVHLSEYAFYRCPPADLLTGIMQAVPDEPGTIVIIESTANGYNDFKDLWDGAVSGENGWTPMFFAWHDMPEYAIPLESEDERASIMGSLSDYERKIVDLYALSAEQIKWYRRTLRIKCRGDMAKMRQENPSYPDEAFLMTGRPVFDQETVQLRIEALKKLYAKQPPKRGRFAFSWANAETQDRIVRDSIHWVDDIQGPITVYEEPRSGHPYVLGGDTKGEGRDWYAGMVLDNSTGRRVAALHMQCINSKPYTWQMYCLGLWYHEALIGIEMNFNTAPIEELQRLNYPRQYLREVYDKIGVEMQQRYGWKTDPNTRPVIIDNEIGLIGEHSELFPDVEMLGECLTFVYDENNRPDAMAGKHDDLLFADMIAAEIRGQQRMKVDEEPKPARARLPEQLKKGKRRR